MTNEAPTPTKKRGRPPKAQPQVATTPQDSPSTGSKLPEGTQVPAEPEIDVQRLGGQVILARHMVQDHRMTWGEVRISLGYGRPGEDHAKDLAWNTVLELAR